mgnify:CR=1 FL=1
MSSLLPVLQILEHMQGGRRVNRRYARRSEDTEQMSVMDWARWNQNAHPELELLHPVSYTHLTLPTILRV